MPPLSALIAAPAIGLVAWTIYNVTRLLRNYASALKVGAPIRVIPIDHMNALWMQIDKKVISLVEKLPGFLGRNSFTRYNFRTWEMQDRWRSHREMGDAFMIVTPGGNWFYVGDPDATMDLLRRRVEFVHPVHMTEMLTVFGPSLSVSEGQRWQRQRKIIGTCFTEQNHEVVWNEALTLAKDMLAYWTSQPPTNTSADDLRTLSLNVLIGAGFGRTIKFEGHHERNDTGKTDLSPNADYKNALQLILENCIMIIALGPRTLARLRPWLPPSWKLAVLAERCATFQKYMTAMYEQEKIAAAQPRQPGEAPTMLNNLVRASQAEDKSGLGKGLTESEIYGNMFILNFAGHDTTAHTLTFLLHFLAAHPDVQEWVSEEARAVLPLDNGLGREAWDYATKFPRLKRCLAVMLETIRLYTPVPAAKWTDDKTVSITVGGKTYVLPPQTYVIPSYASLHTEPRYWGEDSMVWRPNRWIEKSRGPGDEDMITPAKGTFLGWSEGARDCPARRFSQVEVVATVATLLRDWRVDPVPLDAGETMDDARRRVMDLIEKDSGPVLLLQMLHPERVSLRWSRR